MRHEGLGCDCCDRSGATGIVRSKMSNVNIARDA